MDQYTKGGCLVVALTADESLEAGNFKRTKALNCLSFETKMKLLKELLHLKLVKIGHLSMNCMNSETICFQYQPRF